MQYYQPCRNAGLIDGWSGIFLQTAFQNVAYTMLDFSKWLFVLHIMLVLCGFLVIRLMPLPPHHLLLQ